MTLQLPVVLPVKDASLTSLYLLDKASVRAVLPALHRHAQLAVAHKSCKRLFHEEHEKCLACHHLS